MPWQCLDNALTMPWQCPGNALTMPWQCLDNALTMPRQCPGNACSNAQTMPTLMNFQEPKARKCQSKAEIKGTIDRFGTFHSFLAILLIWSEIECALYFALPIKKVTKVQQRCYLRTKAYCSNESARLDTFYASPTSFSVANSRMMVTTINCVVISHPERVVERSTVIVLQGSFKWFLCFTLDRISIQKPQFPVHIYNLGG